MLTGELYVTVEDNALPQDCRNVHRVLVAETWNTTFQTSLLAAPSNRRQLSPQRNSSERRRVLVTFRPGISAKTCQLRRVSTTADRCFASLPADFRAPLTFPPSYRSRSRPTLWFTETTSAFVFSLPFLPFKSPCYYASKSVTIRSKETIERTSKRVAVSARQNWILATTTSRESQLILRTLRKFAWKSSEMVTKNWYRTITTQFHLNNGSDFTTNSLWIIPRTNAICLSHLHICVTKLSAIFFSRLLSKRTAEKFRVVMPCDPRTNYSNYFSRTSLTKRLKILHQPNVGTFLRKSADIPIGKNKDRRYQHPSPSFFLEPITLPFSFVFPSKYTNS